MTGYSTEVKSLQILQEMLSDVGITAKASFDASPDRDIRLVERLIASAQLAVESAIDTRKQLQPSDMDISEIMQL